MGFETGFLPDWGPLKVPGGRLNRPLRQSLNPMRLQVQSETLTNEPVSLATLKNFLRVTHSSDDALIQTMEIAVRRWLEKYLDLALVPKIYNLYQDTVPEERFWVFPINPITGLNAIYWYDLADTQNLWNQTGNYQFSQLDTVSGVFLEVGAVWPFVTRLNDAWQVNFNAGFDNVTNITPEPIQMAIQMIADDWYSNRGQIMDNTTIHMSHAIKSMIEPYKVPGSQI